jgi:hypothetical protein
MAKVSGICNMDMAAFAHLLLWKQVCKETSMLSDKKLRHQQK